MKPHTFNPLSPRHTTTPLTTKSKPDTGGARIAVAEHHRPRSGTGGEIGIAERQDRRRPGTGGVRAGVRSVERPDGGGSIGLMGDGGRLGR